MWVYHLDIQEKIGHRWPQKGCGRIKKEPGSRAGASEFNHPSSIPGQPIPLDRNLVLVPNRYESASFRLIQVKPIA